ncbi:hypothetical protein TVAG_335430 [Trichomonas vaginalis G3]|uniref:DnaK protein n=1 Tax=Trichomonas vaginalis (strain ATCC PRA-98 / G3) TaxID=412133 RepID=A2FC70_TRIV3|nr:HSC70CB, isoform G-related family [Trichomonas vaginalis G3]EAX97483.1 hypothetical protein TVAG_335430 [Trichomonas vaginalis G3]KAI5547053.1 HSC70CB, isoform G-related family [Trichomonas vaginalis G3]|eukprot:XP_001310413.1 hypothetical protein [Trichomonas vaginalis G3]
MILLFLFSFTLSSNIILDIGSFNVRCCKFKSDFQVTFIQNFDGLFAVPTTISVKYPNTVNITENIKLTYDEAEKSSITYGRFAFPETINNNTYTAAFLPFYLDSDIEKSKKLLKTIPFNTTLFGFNFEETLNIFMNRLIHRASNTVENIIVSLIIPKFFTETQKSLLRNAISNAKFKFGTFIYDDDTTWSSLAYFWNFTNRDRNKASVLVEVGATSIRVYTGYIKQSESTKIVEKISYKYSCNEGGLFMTQRMMEFLMDKYNLQNLNELQKIKLFQICEKIKLQFSNSNNTKDEIQVEYDGTSPFMKFTITKDEYLSLLRPIIDEIVKLVNESTENISNYSLTFFGGAGDNLDLKLAVYKELNHEIEEFPKFTDLKTYGAANMKIQMDGFRIGQPIINFGSENYNPKDLYISTPESSESIKLYGSDIKATHDEVFYEISSKSKTFILQERLQGNVRFIKNCNYTFRAESEKIRVFVVNDTISKIEALTTNNTWKKFDYYINQTNKSSNQTMLYLSDPYLEKYNMKTAKKKLEQYISYLTQNLQHQDFVECFPEKISALIGNMLEKAQRWIYLHGDSQPDESEFVYLLSEISNLTSIPSRLYTTLQTLRDIENFIGAIINYQRIETSFSGFSNSSNVKKYRVFIFNKLMQETSMLYDLTEIAIKYAKECRSPNNITTIIFDAASKIWMNTMSLTFHFEMNLIKKFTIIERFKIFFLRKNDVYEFYASNSRKCIEDLQKTMKPLYLNENIKWPLDIRTGK